MNVMHWNAISQVQQRPRPSGRRSWLRKLIVVVLALALLTVLTVRPAAATDESSYSERSEPAVVLSETEADSLLDLLDEQELRITLLEIDLEEAKRLAESDRQLADQQLELQRKSYEAILDAYKDDRDNWLERMAKKPIVWLALGLWLGVQAE